MYLLNFLKLSWLLVRMGRIRKITNIITAVLLELGNEELVNYNI